MKYSNEGDTVFDYSVGFGARMLGALSANRKYIGTDPNTVDSVTNMAKALDLKNYTLIKSGSENYKGEESSIDFCYSSPPYVMDTGKIQEFYTKDETQAYNKGLDYFYNTYWKGTLQNCKYMLKPGKWFGLNVTESCSKMIYMAKEEFGDVVETVKLKTTRSHLNKSSKDDATKFELVYMFKNLK